jgi:toxin-antitoxin system PIN domain toxin
VSRPALLDVNVLVALFIPDHVHHEIAHDWFADNQSKGWATCPITESGFVRVLSNPSFGPGSPKESVPPRPSDLVARLRKFTAGREHVFWPDAVSLTDTTLFDPAYIRGHRQITDVYLLGLAKKMGGLLATLDGAVPLGAVTGATRHHLAVIARSDDD